MEHYTSMEPQSIIISKGVSSNMCKWKHIVSHHVRKFCLRNMISEARDSILHTSFNSVIYLFFGFHMKHIHIHTRILKRARKRKHKHTETCDGKQMFNDYHLFLFCGSFSSCFSLSFSVQPRLYLICYWILSFFQTQRICFSSANSQIK